MDKIEYTRVFLGQNRVCTSVFHVREGRLGKASTRISSRSVWTKPGTKADKNGCMVDKIGRTVDPSPLFEHSRSPVIHHHVEKRKRKVKD